MTFKSFAKTGAVAIISVMLFNRFAPDSLKNIL